MCDLPEESESYLHIFADDAKDMNEMQGNRKCNMMQRALDKVQQWLEKWIMKVDFNKRNNNRKG